MTGSPVTLEFQLELATAKLENMAALLAACTNERRRGRLAAELEFQRRTVARLQADLAREDAQ